MSKKNTNGGFDFNDVVNYIGVSFSDIPQFSYVIDGDDKCHITQWTSRPENGMFPILVPNVGFKKFAEIKPNLETWLTNIRADKNTIQAIHKTRNNFKDVKKDHFFKETYTGRFKDPRTDRFSPSRANQPICGFMTHES